MAASLDLTTYGTPTGAAPLILRGYTAAANDGGQGEIDCGGAPLWTVGTYDAWQLIDLEVHTFGDNNGIVGDDECNVIHCYVHKGASGPVNKSAILIDDLAMVSGCYVPAYGTGTGAEIATGNGFVTDNYVIAHSVGISCDTTHTRIRGNLVVCPGNASGIYSYQTNQDVVGNAVWAAIGNTGAGIYIGINNRTNHVIHDNIVCNFSGVGGRGIDLDSSDVRILGYNAFYNNTANYTDVDNIWYDLRANDVALAADPFVNAAAGDFSYTEAAKTALRSLGWPASYLSAHANSDPHITIGPMQYGPIQAVNLLRGRLGA